MLMPGFVQYIDLLVILVKLSFVRSIYVNYEHRIAIDTRNVNLWKIGDSVIDFCLQKVGFSQC